MTSRERVASRPGRRVQPTHHDPKRSREQTVALLAVTAIGLVVIRALDDAFLQPAAGVGHGDHLLQRPGAGGDRSGRGARHLAHPQGPPLLRRRCWPGAWGLVGSMELFVESGPRAGIQADDVSGILSLVAGAFLLCAFGYFASISASRGRSRLTRSLRRGATAVGLVVAAYAVILPLGVAYMATHFAGAGDHDSARPRRTEPSAWSSRPPTASSSPAGTPRRGTAPSCSSSPDARASTRPACSPGTATASC